MDIALVTGSGGLVGSTAVELLISKGMHVAGIDNDTRGAIFGAEASVANNYHWMVEHFYPHYDHFHVDLRDEKEVTAVFAKYGKDIKLIIHAAGQPSHDWAANAPVVDFNLNAKATLLLLENARTFCPEAVFIFTSTNKVYGDWVNLLQYQELHTRYELDEEEYKWLGLSDRGCGSGLYVDCTQHSLFGVSKAAADLYVQEYGRYFGMETACFRCGCITGGTHRAVKAHGFLAYLAKCIRMGDPYTIFGYKGKQVRDNIHAHDLVRAFWEFYCDPISGAIFNMGGGRENSCSILEAIRDMTVITGEPFSYDIVAEHRQGDHKWWISDTSSFQHQYPDWSITRNLDFIYRELLGV